MAQKISKFSHAYHLNQLLAFIGARDHAPQGMFRFARKSGRSYLGQTLYGLGFLPRLLMPGSKIMVRGSGRGHLDGEVVITDSRMARTALACLRSGRPYIIVRGTHVQPVRDTSTLLGLDPLPELTAYLSLGSLIVFFGACAGRPVVVHVGTAESAQAVVRHYEGLRSARAGLSIVGLQHLAPDVLSFASEGSYRILTQSRLPGTASHLRYAGEVELYNAIDHALLPLLHLRAAAALGANGPDEELVHARFPSSLDRWPEFATFLYPLLARLQAWQRSRGLPGVLTHGDYWLRNVLFSPATGEVSGIVDWERCRPHGTPGLDALHLALMSLAIERDADVTFYLEQAWTGAWESTALAGFVERVQRAYELCPRDIGYLAAILLFDEFNKVHASGGVLSERRRRNILALQPAITRWLIRHPDITPWSRDLNCSPAPEAPQLSAAQ